jgi:hypothetical protein
MYRRTRERRVDEEDEQVHRRTPSHPLLALQASVGNRAVSDLVADNQRFQRKTAVMFATPDEVVKMIRQLHAPPNEDETVTVDFGLLGVQRISLDEMVDLADDAKRRLDGFFTRFADGRAPLFAAMRGAPDADARRQAILALRAYDDPLLPTMWHLHDLLGGWFIEDATARDAVLAAIQLKIASDAEGELGNNREQVHKRVVEHAGMGMNDQWCGFFAEEQYRKSRLDQDFAAAFHHTSNVEDFFTYNPSPINIGRTPRWIYESGRWQSIREYHESRGSLRSFQNHAALAGGGALDIRPGDIALFDWEPNGVVDHIATVASFDPTTSTLITIGGNDSGYVLDTAGTYDKSHDATAQTGGAALGQPLRPGTQLPGQAGGHVGVGVRVIGAQLHGIGRPSLIDFEDHVYDHDPANQGKAPAKAPK